MAKFTAEELAAMAAWDAAIDASDDEDWELNDLIDELVNPGSADQKRKHDEYARREAVLSDAGRKARNEKSARYYEENKDAVRAKKAEYYEKNRDRIRARQRESYLARKVRKAAEGK